ncbi:hypothetical protein GGS24DRAFT_497937 [Hypoxylon argillaceum]|nr:hypothetical protein GGS24DRAFT_497937 [Hypoxylon argillaceum]
MDNNESLFVDPSLEDDYAMTTSSVANPSETNPSEANQSETNQIVTSPAVSSPIMTGPVVQIAPAVVDAIGIVLPNGKFRCTRTDRKGDALTGGSICGAEMDNKRNNIMSHMNKIHNPQSKYAMSQASYANARGHGQLDCDRPKLNGQWCKDKRTGLHSLTSHASKDHLFRGNSASLLTPWASLTDAQRAYYHGRARLHAWHLQNSSTFTDEEKALYERLKEEQIPNA